MNKNQSNTSIITNQELITTSLLPSRERTFYYNGSVTRMQNEKVLKKMNSLLDQSTDPMALFITSPGGTTGTAMSFYDTVTHILQPNLITIGSGDVDSSGVIIFLTGNRRYVTARTTMLLHPAGRHFGAQRYTAREMKAMLEEDMLKDYQYADVVAKQSRGRLSTTTVLRMMHKQTVLSPQAMVKFGLADLILP